MDVFAIAYSVKLVTLKFFLLLRFSFSTSNSSTFSSISSVPDFFLFFFLSFFLFAFFEDRLLLLELQSRDSLPLLSSASSKISSSLEDARSRDCGLRSSLREPELLRCRWWRRVGLRSRDLLLRSDSCLLLPLLPLDSWSFDKLLTWYRGSPIE